MNRVHEVQCNVHLVLDVEYNCIPKLQSSIIDMARLLSSFNLITMDRWLCNLGPLTTTGFAGPSNIARNVHINLTHLALDKMAAISQPLPRASGNSVAIQWQSSVPGTETPVYTGMPLEKELLVASVFPMCFQWSSSGLPVVFQCVTIMQINTGSPLGHHWVLASASVVPVASQCTCGYTGLPVCSNYAN